jgi:membrane protease YdiL (CAAX protease family)
MNRATLRTAGKYLFLLLFVAWFNRLLITTFTHTTPTGQGIAMSTLAALRAIRTTYGTAALIFFAAIVAPISEELLFRGVILAGVGRHIPFWWANGLQACLFALAHDNLSMAPFLIVMAIFAGVLRRRTQNLATSTVLHAMNNVLALFAIPS